MLSQFAVWIKNDVGEETTNNEIVLTDRVTAKEFGSLFLKSRIEGCEVFGELSTSKGFFNQSCLLVIWSDNDWSNVLHEEIVKAIGNEENNDLFNAESLADLKLAAYDALSHDHTNSRVGKQREELGILARDHQHRDHQHEEAIVQNRLHDMQNRGDDEL